MIKSNDIVKALNDQIAAEMYSAHLYLQMSLDMAQDYGMQGFAHWMMCQWVEELGHALKIVHYCISQGADVTLQAVSAPTKTWKDPKSAIEAAYQHEQTITRKVHDLMAMARKVDDYATECLTSWYVKEQVEEEDTLRQIYAQIVTVKDNPSGLLFIDEQLHKRPEPAHIHDYD